jgi:hypothetical protein
MAPTSPDTVKKWVHDDGDSLYRRSLYTFWKRSIPLANHSACRERLPTCD